ncbi:MAG: amidohydrolase family protein [Deltaproteobacteria bacterium]|nr:amidohydrolase family protein [Deltaproteobacteria bacterium]
MQRIDGRLHLPALATAHSHAYQRALRGQAQRHCPTVEGTDPWTAARHELVDTLTPESLYQIARVAYEELRRGGVRTVGEFHTVHHQPGGQPYESRAELAEALINAARAEGLRISLIRVIHGRAGVDGEVAGPQLRFHDASLEVALRDVDDLWSSYAHEPDVRIGVGVHGMGTVSPDWLPTIGEFADRHHLPLHVALAESQAEVEACQAETGKRPVELLADLGLLCDRLVAVHATLLGEHEVQLLGKAQAFVCLCPTTERSRGGGLSDISALYQAGARLCTGVDGHVLTSPLDDLRSIELCERVRQGKRLVLDPPERSPAEELWHLGSEVTSRACGFDDAGATVRLERAAPELSLVREEQLLDAIVFGASDRVFL